MGEEVAQYQGAYKISQGLLDRFGPKRIIDTPITEHGFTGMAVGAAMNGLRPIVEFMTFNFAMQAIDQIINSAAKTLYMSGGQMGCPIVFRGPNGAASPRRRPAQPGLCELVRALPRPESRRPLFRGGCERPAPRRHPRPQPRHLSGKRNPLRPAVSIAPRIRISFCRSAAPKSNAKARHVTIVAYSIMVGVALKAAETMLAEQGIEAEVINLRTLRPLDIGTVVESVKKTNRLVTVEEGWPYAGIGAEVAMQVIEHAFDWLDAPPMRVHGADVPLPYAANLEKLALPQPELGGGCGQEDNLAKARGSAPGSRVGERSRASRPPA